MSPPSQKQITPPKRADTAHHQAKAAPVRNVAPSAHRLACPTEPPPPLEPLPLPLGAETVVPNTSCGWVSSSAERELISLPRSPLQSPRQGSPLGQSWGTVNDLDDMAAFPTPFEQRLADAIDARVAVKKNSSSTAIEGVHDWLVQKLKEERRSVLTHLEDVHINLMQQFLLRINPGSSSKELGRSGNHVSRNKQKKPDKMMHPPLREVVNPALAPIALPKDVSPRSGYDCDFAEQAPQSTVVDTQLTLNYLDARDPRTWAGAALNRVSGASRRKKTPEVIETTENKMSLKRQDSQQFTENTENDAVEVPMRLSLSSSSGLIGSKKDFEASFYGQLFEFFFAFMIFANCCVMAMNMQYNGLQTGYDLSYRTYTTSKEEAWPGGEFTFDALEKTFTVVFTIELMARAYIYRMQFIRDYWTYFDSAIVIVAWVIFFEGEIIQINVTFARLLRLSKLLRLIHVMRNQDVFDSLKVLVAAIRASVNTLFWSLLVLLLIQSVAGLLLIQLLESFLDDDTQDVVIRRRVFGFFGTYYRSKITMFEITYANWVPSCRLLVDYVDESYAAFYMVYRCIIGFAVLMVVKAVFLQQTMKSTQISDEQLAHDQAKKKKKLIKRIETFFNALDTTGDGVLEWDELQPMLASGELAAMLEVFELEVADFENLFKLLDDGDGQISTEEFVAGIQKIKGEAREVDLLEVKQLVKVIDSKLSVAVPVAHHINHGDNTVERQENIATIEQNIADQDELQKEREDLGIGLGDETPGSKRSDFTTPSSHDLHEFETTPRGQAFECFFVFIIFFNTFTMCMDAQYHGMERGYRLGYRTYDHPADYYWPNAGPVFSAFEKFFTVVFTIEWGLRLYIFRRRFLFDKWCYLDFVIVIFGWALVFKDSLFQYNISFVRLARYTKIMRLIHLLRSQEIFDSLKLLVAAIRASVTTLFWSLLVICLIQSVAGLFMLQVLEPFLTEKNRDVDIQRQVFAYWGTFWRAMLTMFEITMGNWVPSCRLLVDWVDASYGAFYLIYRCVIGFAVLMVVQAVFIQQTMKLTKLSDASIAAQKARAKAKVMRRLHRLFKALDDSGDGVVEWHEFQPALQSPEMAAMLEVFGLEVSDFETLFHLLDDGDGRISAEEFVNGVEHIKGPAREIDLMEVKQLLRLLESKVERHQVFAERAEIANG